MTEPQRIPELIEEPADLDVWAMNRIECFAAIVREYKSAAEANRLRDCITIAGIWASFSQVINTDLAEVVDQVDAMRDM